MQLNPSLQQRRQLNTASIMARPPAAGPSRPKSDLLRFTGHRHLRQRVLLSVLSGKSIRIDNIRSDDIHVGLRDHEINLLRLVERITNGSTIEISVTGMSIQAVVGCSSLCQRYILPIPSRRPSGRYLFAHMSCRQIYRILPGGTHTAWAVLQETTRGDVERNNRG